MLGALLHYLCRDGLFLSWHFPMTERCLGSVTQDRHTLWTATPSPTICKCASVTEPGTTWPLPPTWPGDCCFRNTPSITQLSNITPLAHSTMWELPGCASPAQSHSKMCCCAVHTQSTWNTISPEEPISGRKRESVSTFPSSSLLLLAQCPHFTPANTPDKHRRDLSQQKDTWQSSQNSHSGPESGQGACQRSHILSNETKWIFITTANAVGHLSVSGKAFLIWSKWQVQSEQRSFKVTEQHTW